jgi:hypothetical protein
MRASIFLLGDAIGQLRTGKCSYMDIIAPLLAITPHLDGVVTA